MPRAQSSRPSISKLSHRLLPLSLRAFPIWRCAESSGHPLTRATSPYPRPGLPLATFIRSSPAGMQPHAPLTRPHPRQSPIDILSGYLGASVRNETRCASAFSVCPMGHILRPRMPSRASIIHSSAACYSPTTSGATSYPSSVVGSMMVQNPHSRAPWCRD